MPASFFPFRGLWGRVRGQLIEVDTLVLISIDLGKIHLAQETFRRLFFVFI